MMTPMMPILMWRRRPRGLTLVEIMLSVVIVSMILAVIGMIIFDVMSKKREVEQNLRAQLVGPAILRLIATDLEATFVHNLEGLAEDEEDGENGGGGSSSGSASNPTPQASRVDYFVGKSQGNSFDSQDSLHFVTSVDSKLRIGNKQSDITEVGYFLRRHPEYAGLYTLYRREDFHVDRNPTQGGKSIKIYDRVVGLQFRYYKRPTNQSEREAITNGTVDPERSWDNTEAGGVPAAVMVTVWLDMRERPDKNNPPEGQDIRRYRTFVLLPEYPTDEELENLPADTPEPEVADPNPETPPAGGANPGGGTINPGGGGGNPGGGGGGTD